MELRVDWIGVSLRLALVTLPGNELSELSSLQNPLSGSRQRIWNVAMSCGNKPSTLLQI